MKITRQTLGVEQATCSNQDNDTFDQGDDGLALLCFVVSLNPS